MYQGSQLASAGCRTTHRNSEQLLETFYIEQTGGSDMLKHIVSSPNKIFHIKYLLIPSCKIL